MAAARALPRSLDVTVLDPGDYVEFLPNIHELVSGQKQPADLRLDRARLLHKAGHRFVRQAVTVIDPAARRITTADGQELTYDLLLLAVGGIDATYGVPGVGEHSRPFKSVEQCLAIARELQRLSAMDRPQPVVIVGGGLEGVEALGEVLRRHRGQHRLQITLVERNQRLLAEGPPGVDRRIRRHCRDLPLDLRTGAAVEALEPDAVVLAGGAEPVPSALTIWTGGVAPPPLLAAAGLASDPGGWAPVRQTLQSTLAAEVFVAGDTAELPQPVTKQAYHALDMGRHAARNIQRHLAGRALLPFKPASKPTLCAFGDLDTFLIAGNRALAGPALAPMKEAVYQLVMAQLDPPTGLPSAGALQRRLRRGALGLLGAQLSSWTALARNLDLELLT
jgi:NADH dehydrogenase